MKCDNCSNKSICKYVDEMQRIEQSTKDIEISFVAPISLDIKCSSYKDNRSTHGTSFNSNSYNNSIRR